MMLIEKELPLPPVDAASSSAPPPYSVDNLSAFPVPPPPPQHPVQLHAPITDITSVNHVHISNRKQDVQGTYCIDSKLDVPFKYKGKSKCGGRKKQKPNATFQTRHGAISINLATRGADTEETKAYIIAASGKGDVHINLYSLQARKHINLDVYAGQGNVFVLIPRNFSGAIQLRGRRGSQTVLPSLSKFSRVLTSKDKEMLILVGEPTVLPGYGSDSADDLGTDFCQLLSKHGKVVVGFAGEDQWVPEPTTWEKIGEYIQAALKQ